jgi:hypothetical protein
VIGASERAVGPFVGVIGLLVGKGIADGMFVGLGLGRDGRDGTLDGREGFLLGATGNGVGNDVGKEYMVPSNS